MAHEDARNQHERKKKCIVVRGGDADSTIGGGKKGRNRSRGKGVAASFEPKFRGKRQAYYPINWKGNPPLQGEGGELKGATDARSSSPEKSPRERKGHPERGVGLGRSIKETALNSLEGKK